MDRNEPVRENAAAPAMAERQRPPMSEADLEKRRGKSWTLRVASVGDVTPRMRRVQLTADNLDEFTPRASQEIVLQLPQPDGESARRHYTIRHYDPKTRLIDVDFVLHDHETPGVRWAREAKVGDVLEIRGPRGRMALAPDAAWHLFTGDETALPAILGLIETLPAGARAYAFVEIGSNADKQLPKTDAKLDIVWLSRNGTEPGPSRRMLDAIERFTRPDGQGFAYILGETSNVRAQRHYLIEQGMERDRIYAEGYWRPGRIGGHDHVNDRTEGM